MNNAISQKRFEEVFFSQTLRQKFNNAYQKPDEVPIHKYLKEIGAV